MRNRILVALTALLCLSVGSYVGTVWWTRRIATFWIQDSNASSLKVFPGNGYDDLISYTSFKFHGRDGGTIRLFYTWFQLEPSGQKRKGHGSGLRASYDFAPWYGEFSLASPFWIPRRTYYEAAKQVLDPQLPCDPTAWEAWLTSHPNLDWDENQRRVVETKSEAKP